MPAIKIFCHGGAENTEINEMIFSVFSAPPWQIPACIASMARSIFVTIRCREISRHMALRHERQSEVPYNPPMEKIYQLMLEEILPAVAAGDAAMQALVQQSGEGLQLTNGRFTFTLPALFSFTVARHNLTVAADERVGDGTDDYGRFRELLFQRPPNATLAPFGLQVGIELADLDPDLIVYRLLRLDETP